MLFYIDDYEESLYEEKLISVNQNIELIHFIIKNVIEELTSKNHLSFVVEIDDILACIVNLNENYSNDWKNESIQIAQKAQQWLEENFNIYVSVSISKECDNIENISIAYQQALKAMEYRVVVGYKNIIHYDSISTSNFSNSSYYYPTEVEQQLINFIKSGDYEQAHSIVNEIFNKNFSNKLLPVEVVRCLLFDLTCTIIKALDEISIIYEDILYDRESLLDKLLSCETATEIKYQINNILKEACDRINESQNIHNNQLIEDIINYIDSQYYDIDLNVSKIADHFQINLSYLSKFFKKQTGQGLLDYINKVRIEKAKEILREDTLSIKEISKKVGFYNSNAFIRVFKKYEGITPGKYRDSKV